MTSQPPEQEARRTRSVRASEADVAVMWDALDREDDQTMRDDAAPAYAYRHPALQLDVWQLGGSTCVPYAVPSRRLSATGLSLLFGNYLHPSTLCSVKLVTLHGTWVDVEGTVQSCRYIGNHMHDVWLRFMKRADPALFCSEAVACHVLLVEDDVLTARMISAWLAQFNATVRHVQDGEAALALDAKERFDLILMDVELPAIDGLKVTKALRARGYGGRIVAISSLANAAAAKSALDAGCDQFLAKPFNRTSLAELLRTFREEPILSTFQDDESLAELITCFVAELPARSRTIQQALAASDVETLRHALHDLIGQSGMYGFEIIAELAAEVQRAVLNGTAIDEVRRRVGELSKACDRVRSPTTRSRANPDA